VHVLKMFVNNRRQRLADRRTAKHAIGLQAKSVLEMLNHSCQKAPKSNSKGKLPSSYSVT